MYTKDRWVSPVLQAMLGLRRAVPLGASALHPAGEERSECTNHIFGCISTGGTRCFERTEEKHFMMLYVVSNLRAGSGYYFWQIIVVALIYITHVK